MILSGAGDITDCHQATEETARLLAGSDAVFTAGDNTNWMNRGTETYLQCFDPTWGRFAGIMWPVPGNHDYDEPGAYAAHFRPLPPYSFDLGGWHIIGLDSMNVTADQVAWLRQDLKANPGKCTMAVWHYPMFTTLGGNTPNRTVKPFWDELIAAGADLVINGHNHWYERFAPMLANGTPDPKGIRQFIVGTGGAEYYGQPSAARAAGSEVLAVVHGVIRLSLAQGSYSWRFVSVPSDNFQDAGSATCHNQ